MKLTETKLKQMIVEALKKKYDGTPFVDFGIPTADEKLRSKLGDETFDKIQSLDKEQADVMKQTFDPNYPRDLKYETIQSFMESNGFDLEMEEVEEYGPVKLHKHEYYMNHSTGETFSIDYSIKTYPNNLPGKKFIYFSYEHVDWGSSRKRTRENGSIEINDMIDLDMGNYYYPNEEDIKSMSTYIILRIKNELEKIIGIKNKT